MTTAIPTPEVLRVNGTLISGHAISDELSAHADASDPDHAARLALVVRELLTQQARAKGLLAADEPLDDAATDRLIEMECAIPEPTEEECQRYYRANPGKFNSPDLVHARHILFALSPGVSVPGLRSKAEETLQTLRTDPGRFDEMARTLSNCPSGQVGGNLGQLSKGESVPEFDEAVFGAMRPGLLPRLVRTRFGFHIVAIERRIEGKPLPFDAAKTIIARYLGEHVRQKAIQQYLTQLAARADLQGITLDLPQGPLLQ
jgi:peptidyl-prolyl cis-trans isomerase C